jgi:hypothetical protein
MLTWIKGLLGYTDRATAAANRVALAWEDVAAMSEAVRDEMRAKLGAADAKALPAVEDETPRRANKK